MITGVGDVLDELDAAVGRDDATAVARAAADLDEIDDLVDWHQEAARITWTAQYAAFLEEVPLLVEGQPPPRSGDMRRDLVRRSLWMSLAEQWRRRGDKNRPLPKEVRERYAFNVLTRVDAFLAGEAIRLARMRDLGVMTTDDVPGLDLHIAGAGPPAASAAVSAFQRQRVLAAVAERAREEADPGIIRTIWSVVGWDSFSDFAFDVGLIVVTGGGAAVVKWGKTVAKGVRHVNRVRKSTRLVKLADDLEERLKDIDRALEAIRERIGATRRADARARDKLEASAGFLRRHYAQVLTSFFEAATEAIRSQKAKAELVNALKQAWPLASKIATSTTAEELARAIASTGAIEHDERGLREIAAADIAELSSALGVSGLGNLQDAISEAKDAVLFSLLTGAGDFRRLFVRWYFLLVTRQLAIRALVLVARKRSKITRANTAALLSAAVFSALEEALIEAKLPEDWTREVVKQYTAVARKALDRVMAAILAEFLD